MPKFLVINGPNLNMLGRREPQVYGAKTLDAIADDMRQKAKALGVELVFYQSNVEGELINCLQQHWGQIDGIIINPGALTHYGYSLRDALAAIGVPIIEVHLSNIHAREEWRRHSVIGDVVRGQIAGFGWRSYTSALDILAALVQDVATPMCALLAAPLGRRAERPVPVESDSFVLLLQPGQRRVALRVTYL